jgi:hypothetical protein
MLARALVLLAVVIMGRAPALADDRSDACGYVYPVDGYSAKVGELLIELPVNDRLVVNGVVRAEHARYDEGSTPRPWHDSANTAEIAATSDYVLVRTLWTDCVDYSWSRIYVLDQSGSLIATSALWSMHDEFWFKMDATGLTFASDWFCGKDGGAPAGRAYVYVLRKGSTTFRKEERGWKETCSDTASLRANRVFFTPMQPILPANK